MLETPHVIVGAAIATKVVNPALAIPLAFGSHFLLDKLPHWNPHLNKEVKKYGRPTKNSTIIAAIDTSTALVAGTLIASRALPDTGYFLTIMASCLAASLPDIVEAPYFFLGVKNKIMKKWIDSHRSIQSSSKSVFWGLQTQIITVIAALWWILN
jgi:hypothetical protein